MVERKTSRSAGDDRECNLQWESEFEYFDHTTRVQELIPVENIQRLRDYLQAHPELRQATAPGV
jgi:hypothetical protein